MSTEAPSATKRPVSRRVLRMSSERMSLTRSFVRLVMTREAGGGPRSDREVIAAPACEERRWHSARPTFLADRKLAAFEVTTIRRQRLSAELVEHEGRCADRIGREDDRALGPRDERRAIAQHVGEIDEKIPCFVVRPTAELRRIDEDQIILLPAAYLALHELARILEHPAHGRVLEPRRSLVLPRPRDRLLRGVDVRDLGAGVCCEQGRRARVDKQIEHTRALGTALLLQCREH